jgi:hypothetical protein
VFGANVGLLAADLATRYPQTRVLGVEADHDNAVLARRNLAHLAGRCTLKEAGVWRRDEILTLAWAPDAWGQAVTGPGDRNGSSPGTGTRYINAVDAGNLLAAFSGPASVDYLLVNIESAWHEMLRHGQRTANVRCIKIEIQDHYDEVLPMLEALGYQAQLQRLSWGAFATGIRPANQASRPGLTSPGSRPAADRATGQLPLPGMYRPSGCPDGGVWCRPGGWARQGKRPQRLEPI